MPILNDTNLSTIYIDQIGDINLDSSGNIIFLKDEEAIKQDIKHYLLFSKGDFLEDEEIGTNLDSYLPLIPSSTQNYQEIIKQEIIDAIKKYNEIYNDEIVRKIERARYIINMNSEELVLKLTELSIKAIRFVNLYFGFDSTGTNAGVWIRVDIELENEEVLYVVVEP